MYCRPLGTLDGEVHLRVDSSVVPVVTPARKIPIAICTRLHEELDRLCKLGVITPIEEPTPWVNQIVVAQKKSGDLRICLDRRNWRKHYYVKDSSFQFWMMFCMNLGQSRIFTKANLSSSYWHVQLDLGCSMLTTFQTCFGRYCFCLLPFGLSISSEIFQQKLLEALTGLTNVVCIADDVIIHAKDTEQHDEYLHKHRH